MSKCVSSIFKIKVLNHLLQNWLFQKGDLKVTQKRNKIFPSNSHPNAGISFIFFSMGKALKVGIKMKTLFIYIALAGVTF